VNNTNLHHILQLHRPVMRAELATHHW